MPRPKIRTDTPDWVNSLRHCAVAIGRASRGAPRPNAGSTQRVNSSVASPKLR